MEGSTTSGIQTAITNMATTVATEGVDMIEAIIPAIAPLAAAAMVAWLGFKLYKAFSKRSV